SPLVLIAEAVRAILLVSAAAATFLGLGPSISRSRGAALVFLRACWMTAVAPRTSSWRRLSSPARLILPSRCRPAVEFSRGVIPIHAAKCRLGRNTFGSGTLCARLTPPLGPIPGIGRNHWLGPSC